MPDRQMVIVGVDPEHDNVAALRRAPSRLLQIADCPVLVVPVGK
jgi:hypothetical protein